MDHLNSLYFFIFTHNTAYFSDLCFRISVLICFLPAGRAPCRQFNRNLLVMALRRLLRGGLHLYFRSSPLIHVSL